MEDPIRALARLREAAADGRLAELCRKHSVTLLVAFGSAVSRHKQPDDLDLAVRFRERSDLVGLVNDLMDLTGTNDVDLMDLGRAGPVAREAALVGAEVLVEESAGTFAEAQLAAILERMDTRWLRRMDLELMAR